MKITRTSAKQNKKTIKHKNKNNDKGYNKNNNRHGGNSRTASFFEKTSHNFEIEESSVGVVLGMNFENWEESTLRYLQIEDG